MSITDRHAIRTLLQLRLGLATSRYYFSLEMLNRPLNVPEHMLPPYQLIDAAKRANAAAMTSLQWVSTPDKTRTEESVNRCLTSSKVPEEIKKEIRLELDFRKQYTLPPFVVFVDFIRYAAKYFDQE